MAVVTSVAIAISRTHFQTTPSLAQTVSTSRDMTSTIHLKIVLSTGQPTYPVQPRPGPYLSSNAPYSSPNYAQQQQGQPAQMQSHQRRDSSHFQPLPSMYPGAMPSYSNQQPPRSAQSLAYISTHNVGMMQGAYGSSHPVQGGSQSMYATSGQTSSSKSPPPKSPSDRYGCEYCSASFTRAHDRKRHYASAHDDKPSTHVCKHCGKSFSRYVY